MASCSQGNRARRCAAALQLTAAVYVRRTPCGAVGLQTSPPAMRTEHLVAVLFGTISLLIARAVVKPSPIMVYEGTRMGPIVPALPTPPPPRPYPPIPPAPVWEDPEPGYNNLLTLPSRGLAKFGFRVKPFKSYIPQASYSKDYVYPYL